MHNIKADSLLKFIPDKFFSEMKEYLCSFGNEGVFFVFV